ncbi:hypothetical protein EST38_g1297 [Candolleomyces aberdarensis]|uniref:Uncharacterized protein n=1 Tax=Candolleomyces aberdarensis TaxID=2316362 RepID=A0A4Q2DWD8_9AGAR|nr:hypothetical protein EST38_g1297 [Candolleomyces aberdarensis]
MSEDDRAAKAARAKALLAKKRGQKKAAEAAGAISPVASESIGIHSRTFSPATSEASLAALANGNGRRGLADGLGSAANDLSRISSLTRALPPAAQVTSESSQVPSEAPTPAPGSGNHVGWVTSPPGLAKEALLQEKISQLESLNSALQSEARHLQELLEGTRILAYAVKMYQAAILNVSEHDVFAARRKVPSRQLAEETF